METFCCGRCGNDFSKKQYLKQHLRRKTPCEAVISTLSMEEVYQKTFPKLDTGFTCKHCNKKFTHSCNRYRHQAICTEGVKHDNSLNDRIKQLEDQIKNLHRQNITNIQTQNNYNHQITINVNSFGNESYDHLTDEFIQHCLLNNNAGVKALLEKIHFSEDAPQNKNIRLKSLKNSLIEVLADDRWVTKDKNEALDMMITKGCRVINNYYYNTENEIRERDINELDMRIQNFLHDIIGKNNNRYYNLRRRILALVIDHTSNNDALDQ
jgi:hypothetical protein